MRRPSAGGTAGSDPVPACSGRDSRMSGRSASDVFQPVKPALDVPALEREVAERWRSEDTAGPLPRSKRECRAAVQLPRRTDHGQQPDGRPPRLGPDVQGPLPALPHHARRAAAIPERVRLPGTVDRGRGRAGAGVHQQARHRGLRHRPIRRGLLRPCPALRRPDQRAEQTARLLDGLGPLVLHELGREQLHDLALPPALPGTRAPVPRPRRHAVVPAVRDRAVEHGDRDRGLPGAEPPLAHDPAPDHESGP